MLGVISASPGRVGPANVPKARKTGRPHPRAALLNTSWVLYCNRVGWEEGTFYTRQPHRAPGGEVLARAPFLDEHLLVAEIDVLEVDRLRWKLPLLRAERVDVEGP
jgi:predicted amidohydrolase